MLTTALREYHCFPTCNVPPPSSKKAQISNCSSGAHQQFRAEVVYQAAVQDHVPFDKKQVCWKNFPLSTSSLADQIPTLWWHSLTCCHHEQTYCKWLDFTYITVNCLQRVAWIHDHIKWSRHCFYISTPQSGKVHRSITRFYQKQTAIEDNFFPQWIMK